MSPPGRHATDLCINPACRTSSVVSVLTVRAVLIYHPTRTPLPPPLADLLRKPSCTQLGCLTDVLKNDSAAAVSQFVAHIALELPRGDVVGQ